MNRRTLLKSAAISAVPMLNLGRYSLFAQAPTRYSARAVELVQRSTVIDMLNPASLSMVLGDLGGEKKPTWLDTPDSFKPADWARFHESGWNVLHIAVGTGSYDDT